MTSRRKERSLDLVARDDRGETRPAHRVHRVAGGVSFGPGKGERSHPVRMARNAKRLPDDLEHLLSEGGAL